MKEGFSAAKVKAAKWGSQHDSVICYLDNGAMKEKTKSGEAESKPFGMENE